MTRTVNGTGQTDASADACANAGADASADAGADAMSVRVTLEKKSCP
jgi:hypothetical protein